MIASQARGDWNEIASRLRAYIARRVDSADDVDDILQEIFVRMHRGLGSLRDAERFGGWAYRIAAHAVADFGRARAREPLVRVAELPEPASAGTDGEAAALQADLGECVALFVTRLPSPYREAVTLTELEGLTHKQAAELLGITLPAMKSRVKRGRERIRASFEQCCVLSVDCRGRVVACEPRALEDVPLDCRAVAAAWGSRERPS
jgi:RNA polymerase sigma-70 factor (ECF subfamily)